MSDKLSQRLLARAHSPDTASQIYRDKIAHRPLLLRPSSPPSRIEDARTARQKLRAAKIASRRRVKKILPLSAKQKRAKCVYDIPKSQQKYDIYEPLHQMWASYMQDILGIGKKRGDGTLIMGVSAQSAGQQLVTADFHGADVEVVRSRCVSRVGVRGIVAKDTKFTFEIITKGNELKVLPKEHTIFRFEVPLPVVATSDGQKSTQSAPLIFELRGSQFETSAPARAMKKFKIHVDPDL
ncbi:MAG: hypothetical protein Q9165_005737 [Trypethelium subeluteriae]